MRPRWKKVLADLWENKGRSIMVVTSVTVGVFAIGMIGVGYYLIPEGIQSTYSQNKPENITIRTDYFDEELLDTINQLPGVAAAEAERMISVRARGPNSAVWENFQINFIPDPADRQIKKLTPVTGHLQAGKHELILLDDPKNLLVETGQVLEILLQDGTTRQLTVVGTARNYTAGRELLLYSKIGFMSGENMDYLHTLPYYTTLHVAVDGDVNDLRHIQEVSERVVKRLENAGREIYGTELKKGNEHPFSNYLTAISGILGVVGLFIVILSGSLIVNTMNALISQQMRQIGVIKLVGGRRAQIVLMYILMVLIYGIVALAVAVPGGAYAGYRLSEAIAPVLNGKLKADVPPVPLLPPVILFQSLVAVLIPLGAALLPVIHGARVTVQQALSGSLINQTERKSLFDRWLKNWRFLEGVPQLALRNTFRRKGRLLLTLFTLAFGGAILIAVFNVQLSMNNQIDRVVRYNGGDIFLNLARPYPVQEIEALLTRIPEVEIVESWLSTTAQLRLPNEIESINLLAPPDDTQLLEPGVLEGRWVQNQDDRAMVVNESFLNTYPDLKPGDAIPLEIKGQEQDWTVTGIFHYTGMDEKIAFTNAKSLSSSLNANSANAHYRLQTSQHSLSFQKRKAEQINAFLRVQGYQVASVYPINDFLEGPFEKLDLIIYVLLILAILTSVVGSIGLSGTLSLNVLERTSEIGILRAIGAYDRVVSQLIIIEGFIIGFVSYLLSLLLSIPMTRLLTTLINNAIFGIEGQMVFTATGVILWALILLVFSVFSSLAPARNATRLTIREVLAYE